MKYCARCGAELNNDAAICTKCGCAVDGMRGSSLNSTSNDYNTLAIVGFVLSFFTTIVGLILSIIAYKQVKESGEKGKELAIAGIVISSVEIAIVFLVLFIYFVFIFAILGSVAIY